VNKYLSEQAPWKLKDDRERLGTILNVTLQAINDCNTLISPFLPHTSQKIHGLLGNESVLAPMPRIEEVSDLDGGPGYPIITGSYQTGVKWEPRPITVGATIEPPTPVFRKLDPSIVDEELARFDS
jgi:methionyl-tRNA synthetase